jgi:RimJ/RimL family protein N-acetyltransferase
MMDAAFAALTSERLVLRRFRPEDLDAFVAYRSDPEIARYQSWEAPYRPARPASSCKSWRPSTPTRPASGSSSPSPCGPPIG